jgi:hypothetical protein
MKHFTIDAENNITLHPSRKEAHAAVAELAFSTEEQFADAIGNDSKRLIEIWNSLPGVTPVKKFTNRKIATERIWRAVQNLGGTVAAKPTPEPEADAIKPDTAPAEVPPENAAIETVAEPTTPFDEPEAPVGAQAPDVAPVEAEATNNATQQTDAPTAEPKAKEPRAGSKTDQAISMMKRPGGATLKELMDAFGWQAHTVRGFVAGALTKKLGLTVASTKSEKGERTYSIA